MLLVALEMLREMPDMKSFCPEGFAWAFPEVFVATDLLASEFFSFFLETELPFFN